MNTNNPAPGWFKFVTIIGLLFLVPFIIFLIAPVILAHAGDAAEERARREMERPPERGRRS